MTDLSRLSIPAYAVCTWLVVFTAVDALLTALPLSPSMAVWRYSLGSHLMQYMLSPMIGVFLALVISTVLEHQGVLRAVSFLSGLAGVGLLMFSVVFIMDSLALRGAEQQGVIPPFSLRWGVVMMKLSLSVLVAGAVFRSARAVGKSMTGGHQVSSVLRGTGA